MTVVSIRQGVHPANALTQRDEEDQGLRAYSFQSEVNLRRARSAKKLGDRERAAYLAYPGT